MKLLFTDLDGTLLNNNSLVSPGTRAFLDEFLAAGNRLILSSGRPTDSVLEVKDNAGLTQPGILLSCYNGAQVYDCDSRRAIMDQEEQHTLRAYQNKEITLGVRPENIVEGPDVPVTVSSNENLGMNTLVHGHIGDSKAASAKISAKLKGWRDYKVGDTASFTFNRKHFFDKETTNAIRGGEG